MPKVKISDQKGLVQSSGSGFEAESLPKAVYRAAASMTKITVVQAANVGTYTGGKYIVLHGKAAKYQLYFSGVGGANNQPVPAALSGHTLVKIGNIGAAATAAQIATAIIDAIGAGAGNGLAELSAVIGHNADTIIGVSSLVPQAASGVDHGGTIAATAATVEVMSAGAGDGTLNLRPGAVNHIDYSDMADVNASAINQDHTDATTLDGEMLVLPDGDYAGQECTIARTHAVFTDTVASPVVKVKVVSSRALDGGADVSNQALTFENSAHADGSPLLKGAWDGVAWQWFTIGAVAQYGIAGLQDAD